MKRGLVFLFIFFILLNVNIVLSFSSENIGNLSHSIEKSYGPSENIKGWINISLEDEPSNSLFESNVYSISLINLLKTNMNKDIEYTCSPLTCETDYSSSNPETEKTFSLDAGESIVFGFEFTENLDTIKSVNFTIESTVNSSCYNQLSVDFFNDETIYVVNNKVKDAPDCDFLKSYGCYNEGETLGAIGTIPYCQRIKLTESPGFKLGAWVKEEIEGGELTMELYDISGNSKKSCKLNMEEVLEEGGEVSCSVNYSAIGVEDYYVCVDSDGEGEYKIKGNPSPSQACGFNEDPTNYIPPETSSYNIYAEGKRFKELAGYHLKMPDKDYLGGETYNYLEKTYGINIEEGYMDCSTGCVVPIKFTAGKLQNPQNIIIKDLLIIYDIVGLSGAEETNFYDLSETTATINADFQQLYLDEGNFSVPDEFGNHTFSLSLNDTQIFSEKLVVGRVPIIKNLKPRTTASAYPTEFEATVESEENIIKYEWDFGNNNTETTTTNKVIHTYSSTGKYKLTITVIDSSQSSSSKEFEIDVGSPKEIINNLLKQMLTNLNNIKTQINEFSSFYQDSLKSILDVESFESELEKIQTANASATNEEDYNLILTDLLDLEIPESVSIIVSTGSISFYPKEENINLNILKIIGGGDYDTSDESKYIDAIFRWNQKNMETKITFNELSAKYEYFEEPVLKIFELKINENPLRGNSYLIIPKLDNLKFKEDYSEEEKEEYFYIDLTDSQKIITFSTTEDINFIDLPVFISPTISELSITEGPDEKDEALSKMALFILIILLLAIIGVVVYVILQGWYKKKYEDYLFKNRNELYNLISYIQSSKKKGLENKKIIIRLKKAGWKSEQITYIMRKYAGERTGMLEIPIGKVLSKFKKKKVKSIPPRKPVGNFSGTKTFNPNFNPRRNKKRFS